MKRGTLTRLQQEIIAKKITPGITVREIAVRYNITVALAETIVARFDISVRPIKTVAETRSQLALMKRHSDDMEAMRLTKEELHRQISGAHAVAKRTKPFKPPGPLEW